MQPSKPFRYLMEDVRRDAEAWCERRARQASSVDLQLSSSDDIALVGGRSAERTLSLAFDHDEPAVRGSAWSMIATMNADAVARPELIRLVQAALSTRFLVSPSAATDELASHWLNGVRDVVAGVEGRAGAAAAQRRFVERGAGSDLAMMESSAEAALGFLQHAEPARRIAAIQVLLGTIEGRGQIGPRLAEIALSDLDLGVRITALRGFVQAHRKDKHPAAMSLLAGVVRDDSAPIALRDAAYEGLYEVGDTPVSEWPIVKTSQGRFEFPKDVDWEFVARFCPPA